MRVCWSKKEEQETRNKIREHVLLLHLLCCVCGGSALTVLQSGHLGHVPVPDGLVEVLGEAECCRLGERFEPTSPRTKEKNTRRSEHKGNTEKGTEDDSAAGPAIEAACESLLVQESERIKKNKKQRTKYESMCFCCTCYPMCVADPHSLLDKVVTLATSQSPMGWLKMSAS